MIFTVLETERLVLRRITMRDASALFAIFSDQQVMQFYDCEPLSNIDEMKNLIQRFSEWFEKQNGFRWGIELKTEPGTIVGTCGLFSWHKPSRTASLGYELAPKYWRRGIMSEAVCALLFYGFNDLLLNRIRATVTTGNIASARLLEQLSFQKEGLLRQAQFLNGKFDDLFVYALLREEWKPS
jgi:[ribosomal protein S5]-alanine N-acetyltransferase